MIEMNPKKNKPYSDLCAKLGYQFKNQELLVNALTHSSYSNDKNLAYSANNERLEFLGDSIFNAIISEELFNRLDKIPEGRLSKLRAIIVCEKSLHQVATKLNISKYIRVGFSQLGSSQHDGEYHAYVADAMEAVIAAVYKDSDWYTVKDIVLRLFSDIIDGAAEGHIINDYKTTLQETLISKDIRDFRYVTDREEGPDHDKTFYVSFVCNGEVLGSGSGKSKKEAQQAAAKSSLKMINEDE